MRPQIIVLAGCLCLAPFAASGRQAPPSVTPAVASAQATSPVAPATAPPAPNVPANQETKQSPAGANEPKPAQKPAKVITDDDIDNLGGHYPSAGGIDLDHINDCNRSCFEQIRQAAGIYTSADPQWRHELVQGIEKVKADSAWQALLREIVTLKERYCKLANDKNEELARRADPNNVTETELSIDEKYDRKFEAAQQNLLAVHRRAQAMEGTYPRMVGQFMNLQEQRIMGAYCQQPRSFADDPYDP